MLGWSGCCPVVVESVHGLDSGCGILRWLAYGTVDSGGVGVLQRWLKWVLFIASVLVIAASNGVAHNMLQSTPSHLLVAEGPTLQVFASYDEGRRWQQVEPLPDGMRYGVFTGPLTGVWLATHNGLFWAPEHLWSWQRVLSDPVAWITWSPSGEHCLFKVWGGGLHWASEGGLMPGVEREAHDRLGLPMARPVQSAVVTDDGHIYISLFDVGVFVSRDRGVTWEALAQGEPAQQTLLLARSPAGVVFAGTFGGGLLRWSGTSEGWQVVDPDLAGAVITAVAFDQEAGIAVGTREQGLFVSVDGGANWERDPLVEQHRVAGVAAVSGGQWWLYQPEGGLFVQQDRSQVWSPRPFRFTNRIEQVAVSSDGLWYINVTGAGLGVSADEGESWRLLELPVPWSDDRKFAVTEAGHILLAAADELWRSEDQGQSWQREPTIWGEVPIVFLHRSPAGVIHLAVNERGGLYYLDAHNQWNLISAAGAVPHSYWVQDVLFFPERTVAYGVYDVLFQTEQGWEHTHFGQSGRAVFQTPTGELKTERVLSTFALDPVTERWTTVESVPSQQRLTTIHRYDDGEHIGFGKTTGLGWWFHDEEVHWAPVFEAMEILDVCLLDDRRIVAGTTQGLWLSQDRGRTWSQVDLLF